MGIIRKSNRADERWDVEHESCRRFDLFFDRVHSLVDQVHFGLEIGYEHTRRFVLLQWTQFALGVLSAILTLVLLVKILVWLIT